MYVVSNLENRQRFEKAYIGRVTILGTAYNIQTRFEMEGLFTIRVISMGGNVCLFEEMKVGFIEDLIGEDELWWKEWFVEIKRWSDRELDDTRVVWIIIFGIQAHV